MQDTDWDDSVRKLLLIARQESFALGDEYIGTQHLLLAAVGVTPIEHHGIGLLDRESVIAAIVECIGIRSPDVMLLTPGAQTPGTKLVTTKAWERAKSESRRVTCRDIWFGLLGADSNSPCQKIIQHLGIRPEAIQQRLT
jgi:Clp amino terminal domain, pathogenicity island component